jgi:Tol biopolymer transport system component
MSALFYFRGTPASVPKLLLEITGPGRTNLQMAVSPDGRAIVYDLTDQGKTQLWIRPLDGPVARPVAGTDDAAFPFWSPDSRSLAFFQDGKLKRIELSGGPVQTLAAAENPRGGTWNSEGTIIFNGTSSGTLSRISLDGRTHGPATQLQTGQGSHRYPQFLPDGKHFLYLALGKPEVAGVYLGSLDSLESKRILAADSQAVYVPPGYLLFLRQGILLAQRFDLKTFALIGNPQPQAEHVAMTFTGWVVVSAANNGMFAYRSGSGSDSRFTWLDRSGNSLGSFGPVGNWGSVDLSKDETRVASHRTDNGNVDVWMIEALRGVATRLTFDVADDEWPVWSPDGSQIAFNSNRKGPFDIYQMSIRDVGKESTVITSSLTKGISDWSTDGRIVYMDQDENDRRRLWVRPLSGDGPGVAATQRSFSQFYGSFSPDGRWIAYESNESGRNETYIQAFPDSGEKVQVSLEGGSDPRWSGDGKELFYVSLDNTLMAATITVADGGKQIRAAKPVPLFPMNLPFTTGRPHTYAVGKGGQRFLMPVPVQKSPPPIILVNGLGNER